MNQLIPVTKSYQSKYHKYLVKYANIVSNASNLTQMAGSNDKSAVNIFDLSVDYGFGNNVQKNIKKIIQLFGKKFTIKSSNPNITINITMDKFELPNGNIVNTMSGNSINRATYLAPFRIDFYNVITGEIKNESYISDIHKTNDISGTDLVKLCLEINRKLLVRKTYIDDGSSIVCNGYQLSLAFIKLLERKQTFYMKLGFDYEINNCELAMFKFASKRELKKKISDIIDNIRKIKTSDLITEMNDTIDLITRIVKENYKQKLTVSHARIFPFQTFDVETPANNISFAMDDCLKVLPILINNRHHKYFYKILVDLFKNKCTDYVLLQSVFCYSTRYQISYGKTTIKRPYVVDFMTLNRYSDKYMFSYQFEKN